MAIGEPITWLPTTTATSGYWSTTLPINQNLQILEQAVGEDVALVKLRFYIPNVISIDVEGSAKRDPIDPANKEVALDLAYARALEKVVRKLNKRAWGKIKHNDDMRDYKAAQKKKKNQENMPWGELNKLHEKAVKKLYKQGKLF